MPGMKIKVPSKSVHMKQQAGAGSAPPKQYVKEVQRKEFAATPTPLGIEDEEEVTYQSAPITQRPAMQQTQKEVQVKPQKEMQVKPQKEVQVKPQKEMQVKPQKEVQVKPQKRCKKNSQFKRKTVCYSKTTCDRKTKPAEKENTKFSVNVLPRPPQPPIKPKKNIKFQM